MVAHSISNLPQKFHPLHYKELFNTLSNVNMVPNTSKATVSWAIVSVCTTDALRSMWHVEHVWWVANPSKFQQYQAFLWCSVCHQSTYTKFFLFCNSTFAAFVVRTCTLFKYLRSIDFRKRDAISCTHAEWHNMCEVSCNEDYPSNNHWSSLKRRWCANSMSAQMSDSLTVPIISVA
jgi:hypothetical protein